MTAIKAALSGLIDYAGLYPPAALDMQAAVRNYLAYRESPRAALLGRFIVNLARLAEMREIAGSVCRSMRLSVIGSEDTTPALIWRHLDEGFRIESIEIKSSEPAAAARIAEQIPDAIDRYFEIPIQDSTPAWIKTLATNRSRAKLRMGGVTGDSFPRAAAVIAVLAALAQRKIPFKATAGLHHPIRSCHRLTYAADSPSSTMHGFANLICAACVLYYGGRREDAEAVLCEENPQTFRVAPECIGWRTLEWSADQLHEVRSRFFLSFGSCSFTEPIQDLEALGWLLP